MRRASGLLGMLFITALIWGCGEKLTEEQLRAKALDLENKEQWAEAAKLYEAVVDSLPESRRERAVATARLDELLQASQAVQPAPAKK